jgi:hypothetical protein
MCVHMASQLADKEFDSIARNQSLMPQFSMAQHVRVALLVPSLNKHKVDYRESIINNNSIVHFSSILTAIFFHLLIHSVE